MYFNTVLDPQHKALGFWSTLSRAETEKKHLRTLWSCRWTTEWKLLKGLEMFKWKMHQRGKKPNQPKQSVFAQGSNSWVRPSETLPGLQIRPRFSFYGVRSEQKWHINVTTIIFNIFYIYIFNRLPSWKRNSVPAQPWQPNSSQCFPSQGLNTRQNMQGGNTRQITFGLIRRLRAANHTHPSVPGKSPPNAKGEQR